MADAAKLHVRDSKFKVGAHVSVSKNYFIEDAAPDARYYGHVVRILSNDDIRVKWVIDNTQSLVNPSELRIEEIDVVETETHTPAPQIHFGIDASHQIQVKKERKVLAERNEEKEEDERIENEKGSVLKVKIERRKHLRKKNKICYIAENIEGREDEETQECDSSKKKMKMVVEEKTVRRESKRNVMEQERIKDINEHNDNDNNICVNDVLDALVSNKKWLGADLFLTPPDGNGSDEDSGDENEVPEFHHLSKKQLLASCEVQVVRCDEDEVCVITNKNELTQLESSMLTETDDSDTNSIWEK